MLLRAAWTLDPTIVFLNHGSFGACPRAVLDAQSALRAKLEENPIHFFLRELEPMLADAREKVAAFVSVRPEDLVFVRNATAGVSAVLRSLRFAPGDELLTTDHAYAACKNALEYVCEGSGASIVTAKVPFPLASEDEVVSAIVDCAGPRTKLALIDHVTSPTGLVFPIERIVRELDARGIDTLVDGAHAPGMVELSIEKIGAAYYTANFHKWPCAPKGAAMLWIRADKQEPIVPPVISHGFRSSRPRKRLLEQFDWTGTDDPTPWLCMPIALDHVASLGGGWPAVRAHNRALVLCARAILCDALGIDPPAPEGMIGALAALPIPPGKAEAGSAPESNPLQHHLFAAHRIEVPVMQWPSAPGRLIRVSAHLHNVEDDYRTLAQALGSALA